MICRYDILKLDLNYLAALSCSNLIWCQCISRLLHTIIDYWCKFHFYCRSQVFESFNVNVFFLFSKYEIFWSPRPFFFCYSYFFAWQLMQISFVYQMSIICLVQSILFTLLCVEDHCIQLVLLRLLIFPLITFPSYGNFWNMWICTVL